MRIIKVHDLHSPILGGMGDTGTKVGARKNKVFAFLWRPPGGRGKRRKIQGHLRKEVRSKVWKSSRPLSEIRIIGNARCEGQDKDHYTPGPKRNPRLPRAGGNSVGEIRIARIPGPRLGPKKRKKNEKSCWSRERKRGHNSTTGRKRGTESEGGRACIPQEKKEGGFGSIPHRPK